jgi:hypothetical protein
MKYAWQDGSDGVRAEQERDAREFEEHQPEDDMSDDLSQYDGHTPGPWEYQKRDWRGRSSKDWYVSGNQYEYDPADDGDEGEPYLVSTSVCIVPTNDSSHPVCENTARLICAAPDLLARCRTLEADLRRAVEDRAKLREFAVEVLRAFDRGAGRQIADVTRWEMEPIRKLAESALADLDRPTPPAGG